MGVGSIVKETEPDRHGDTMRINETDILTEIGEPSGSDTDRETDRIGGKTDKIGHRIAKGFSLGNPR